MNHEPSTHAVVKMDTPTGLWRGGCSCGWKSDGIEDRASAFRSARQHADAKEMQENPDYNGAGPVWS